MLRPMVVLTPALAAAVALPALLLACGTDSGADVGPPNGSGGVAPGAGGAPIVPGGTGGVEIPAGTGGMIVPGSGGVGAGGTPPTQPVGQEPFAGYDPTVQFSWPEAMATAGSCKAGRYAGTFAGMYASPAAVGFPIPVAGDVRLVLEESQDGEFFVIADGTIEGLANGLFPFSSGLTGRLNCTTAQLEDGFMPMGSYNAFGILYPYEGPLDAAYDKLTNAFVNGTWQVGEPTYHRGDPQPQFGGQGTWGVNYVGP